MLNHPWEYHVDTSRTLPIRVLQTCIFKILNHEIISIGVVFSSNLFSSHFLAWTWALHLRLQLLLVSFISQSLLNRFKYNLYYCLPYACSTSSAIFRLILSLKSTPESLLHSRVKYSITHNISVVICSSNFKRGLL